MEKLHLPENLKVHFAGLEKPNYAIVAAQMGIQYGLYTAFPFVAQKLFGKRVWPIIPFKWMTDTTKEVPWYVNNNMRHTIQDSGLYSLLFGKHQDKATKDMIYRWYDKLVEFTLEHGQDVTCVEVDAQAIIGVEETWKLRERMRNDLPNNRIINVFHIEDGKDGLDRLIEYSDYLAIGSGVTNNGLYARPLVQYIKEKKPSLDIHLLGCTKESVLRECATLCTSSDSVTWQKPMQFGEFDNSGYRIESLDSEKVKKMFGKDLWDRIREYNGEKITNASIVSATIQKNRYTKWCGCQDCRPLGVEIKKDNKNKKHSVILLSGGMDSVTLLYDKKEEIALAILFDYGANHNKKEGIWAEYHCKKLGIPIIKISLDFMGKYFTGNILHGANNVKDGANDDSKKDSVVPFRNGILLSIACGVAESNGLDAVLIANHKAETTTLPDCSEEFINGMNMAMQRGTYVGVKIDAPYTEWGKSDIVRHGNEIGLDYSKTYSCYKGGDIHCGVCPACVERKKSLADANIDDNTIYEQ